MAATVQTSTPERMSQGGELVFADFAHFVAECDRDWRERRWKVIAWVGAAFLTKSPDVLQWAASRVVRMLQR